MINIEEKNDASPLTIIQDATFTPKRIFLNSICDIPPCSPLVQMVISKTVKNQVFLHMDSSEKAESRSTGKHMEALGRIYCLLYGQIVQNHGVH